MRPHCHELCGPQRGGRDPPLSPDRDRQSDGDPREHDRGPNRTHNHKRDQAPGTQEEYENRLVADHSRSPGSHYEEPKQQRHRRCQDHEDERPRGKIGKGETQPDSRQISTDRGENQSSVPAMYVRHERR